MTAIFSQPGISKDNWTYASHSESIEQAFEKMKQFKYDILPVRDVNGLYKKYFRTKEWGKFTIENIEEHKIKQYDCLDNDSAIEDVIKAFAERKRNYFFLSGGKEIIGLINISNLNSKQVYVFAYNLIARLELALGKLINESGINDHELIRILADNNKSVKPLIRYRREDKKGLDHKFIECAYLGDMAWIINEKKLYRKIKLDKKEFDSSIKLINKLRNIASHPVNSLIKGENSVVELNLTIRKADVILKNINDYLLHSGKHKRQ